MKWLGAIVMIIGCWGLGYSYYDGYKNRVNALSYLCEVLSVMEKEVSYSRAALPFICKNMEKRLKLPYSAYFSKVCERTGSEQREDFDYVWKEEMTELSREIGIKKEDLSVLLSTFCAGVNGNVEMQRNMILMARERLELNRDTARNDKREKGRVVLCLGMAGGLIAAILVI